MKKNKVIYIFKKCILLPRKVEIYLIELYQKYISPSLGKNCRFYPTCSEYTRQAVDKYGIIKGNLLGLFRIIRCNPFSKGGIDYLK